MHSWILKMALKELTPCRKHSDKPKELREQDSSLQIEDFDKWSQISRDPLDGAFQSPEFLTHRFQQVTNQTNKPNLKNLN